MDWLNRMSNPASSKADDIPRPWMEPGFKPESYYPNQRTLGDYSRQTTREELVASGKLRDHQPIKNNTLEMPEAKISSLAESAQITASTTKQATASEVRKSLLKRGFDENILSGMTDNELLVLRSQWVQLSRGPAREGAISNWIAETQSRVAASQRTTMPSSALTTPTKPSNPSAGATKQATASEVRKSLLKRGFDENILSGMTDNELLVLRSQWVQLSRGLAREKAISDWIAKTQSRVTTNAASLPPTVKSSVTNSTRQAAQDQWINNPILSKARNAAEATPVPAAKVASSLTSQALEDARKAAEGLRFRGNVPDETYTPYLRDWDEMMDMGMPNEYRTYGAGSAGNYGGEDITGVSKKLEEVAISNFEARAKAGQTRLINVGSARSPDQYGKNAYIGDTVRDLGRKSKTFGVVDQKLAKDTTRKIFQVYGDDPGGRQGTILYSLPLEEAEKLGLADKLIEKGYSRFARGGIVYANNGMLIPYSPRGTDTVPAMLTPGEFVINRDSTQKYKPVLEAINSGNYSRGGIVNYLKQGGYITPRYFEGGAEVPKNTPSSSFDFTSFLGNLSSQIVSSITSGFEQTTVNLPQNANNPTNNINNGVSSDSINQIGNFVNSLNNIANVLSNLYIPPEITITGKHDVVVTINGDAALQQLEPSIRQIVMGEINKAMSNLQANNPQSNIQFDGNGSNFVGQA